MYQSLNLMTYILESRAKRRLMGKLPGIPPTWYTYQYPLPEIKNAPVPSTANYSPKNVAPLMEFFAGILGKQPDEIQFRYENNSADSKADDIRVDHPGGDYLGPYLVAHKEVSSDMKRYEQYAKKSLRLRRFQDSSPAKIKYFQDAPKLQ
jgi:hypothetical protein